MAQVILIENNKALNDLLAINLIALLGIDIIQRKNGQEAIHLLSILPSVDLIICKKNVENEDSANDIHQYLIENKLETNLIVLGGDVENKNFGNGAHKYQHVIGIADGNDWKKVIYFTAKILGFEDTDLEQRVALQYVPIPVKYFLNIDRSNCDVFIRIKKAPLRYQYLKRIHAGDYFSRDSILRYLNQGLKNFYIIKEDQKNFSILMSNILVEKIDSGLIDETKKIQLMGEAYDIATREITHLGFSSEVIQLTETIINNMLKILNNSPEMSGLLHKIINSKTGQLYQRSYMTSVVACEIIKNLNLDHPAASEKITYAAFFNDIALADFEALLKICSYEEIENAKLTESNRNLVLNHAHEAALIIAGHPEMPEGVEEIIRHHHGAFNGKGFTNSIGVLPDLSKIFIVAHHFVLELMRFKEKGGEAKPITTELYKRYPSTDIVIIIKALEQTLKKRK